MPKSKSKKQAVDAESSDNEAEVASLPAIVNVDVAWKLIKQGTHDIFINWATPSKTSGDGKGKDGKKTSPVSYYYVLFGPVSDGLKNPQAKFRSQWIALNQVPDPAKSQYESNKVKLTANAGRDLLGLNSQGNKKNYEGKLRDYILAKVRKDIQDDNAGDIDSNSKIYDSFVKHKPDKKSKQSQFVDPPRVTYVVPPFAIFVDLSKGKTDKTTKMTVYRPLKYKNKVVDKDSPLHKIIKRNMLATIVWTCEVNDSSMGVAVNATAIKIAVSSKTGEESSGADASAFGIEEGAELPEGVGDAESSEEGSDVESESEEESEPDKGSGADSSDEDSNKSKSKKSKKSSKKSKKVEEESDEEDEPEPKPKSKSKKKSKKASKADSDDSDEEPEPPKKSKKAAAAMKAAAASDLEDSDASEKSSKSSKSKKSKKKVETESEESESESGSESD